MSSDALPTTREVCSGIPPDAEAQGETISNNNPLWSQRRGGDTIRRRGLDDARLCAFRRRVDQDVEMRRDMQMGELQRPRQSNDERNIRRRRRQRALPFGFLGERGQRPRGNPARPRRVFVDDVLDLVEECVADKVDCAIDVLFGPEEELQRSFRLVADRKGNVLQLTAGVGHVFSFTVIEC